MILIARTQAAQAVIDAFHSKPFVWGQTDCLNVAALALKKLGHTAPLMGVAKYSTERGALKAMKQAGHASLADAVDAYGLTRIPPASALPGDIVAYLGDGFGGYGLGVCLGDDRLLGCANGIVDHAPMSIASIAWRAV